MVQWLLNMALRNTNVAGINIAETELILIILSAIRIKNAVYGAHKL